MGLYYTDTFYFSNEHVIKIYFKKALLQNCNMV